MRGVFVRGKFSKCADWPAGTPKCMGRADSYGEDYREMGSRRCTCVSFTVAEMTFAREHELSIDGYGQLPREWRDRRHQRDIELDQARREAREEALAEIDWIRDEAAHIVESRENRSLDRRAIAALIRAIQTSIAVNPSPSAPRPPSDR